MSQLKTPHTGPRPRKRFGQHFLTDSNIIEKILDKASITEGERVLEIGPGRGALTSRLIEAGALVTAIEIDRDLAAMLRKKYSDAAGFELIEADVLKLSFTDLAGARGCRFKAVANLPYNISGPLTARIIEQREAFTRLLFMYQKEVADRLVAGPGTKDYGVLSVLSQMYMDVRTELRVPPGCFAPPPKVDSAVVGMTVLEAPRYPVVDYPVLKRVVKAAFGQRRKTLSNALKALGLGAPEVAAAAEAAGIDLSRRGETLSVAEFAELSNAVSGIRG